MALPASSICPPTSKLQIKTFKNQSCQLHRYRWPSLHVHPRSSPSRFVKMTNAQFGDPNKIRLQLNTAKDKLWEVTPDPVKEFPWRKAGDMVLNRLMFVGQTTLKWSLVSMFILTFILDIVFSFSRSQELLIPIGLLIGYSMTNYLKEILLEIVRTKDNGFSLLLASISCFFVLVKVFSTYFAAGTRILLLHVANGGLIQVLWLWRQQQLKENDEQSQDNFSPDSLDAQK